MQWMARAVKLIGKLAKAIENEKDLNVLVEGHTDTDKVMSSGAVKDNWDLSVMQGHQRGAHHAGDQLDGPPADDRGRT